MQTDNDKHILEYRTQFLRNVYSLLCIEVLVTMILLNACMSTPVIPKWLQENVWIVLPVLLVNIIVMYMLMLKQYIPYSHNILLGCFALVHSVSHLRSTMFNELAIAITVMVTLTLYAFQVTRLCWSSNWLVNGLCGSFIVAAIIQGFAKSTMVTLMTAFTGIIVNSIAIVYDTRRLFYASYKFGAFELYFDFMNLYFFIHIILAIIK